MLSLRFEQDFKLLNSKYRFKKFSKLCTYISSRGALQRRHFTLFEILDTLRIILRTEGHYSKRDPWYFLCPKDLERALGKGSFHAKQLRALVLQHQYTHFSEVHNFILQLHPLPFLFCPPTIYWSKSSFFISPIKH